MEFTINETLDKPIVKSEVVNEVLNIEISGPADETNDRGFEFGFVIKLDENGRLDRDHIQNQIETNGQHDLEQKADQLISEITTSETTTSSTISKLPTST